MSIKEILLSPFRDLFTPPASQKPALDVLRSAAILMVMGNHLNSEFVSRDVGPSLFLKFPLIRAGWIGVDLFFVLSGYLIGRQLWKELKATSTINVGQFLLRRGLRIWPLYFVVLLLTVLVIRPNSEINHEWWHDACFIANYVHPGVVDGSWSLCVEEQFYIFAPLFLLLLMPRLGSIERYRPYLIGLTFLLPVIRALTLWQLGPNPTKTAIDQTIYSPFHTHSDGLLLGMLLANFELSGHLKRGASLLTRWWIAPLGLALCVLCYAISSKTLNFTGLSLAFSAITCSCLVYDSSMPRWVSSRVFYLLSRLSYGMYLNHQWFRGNAVDIPLSLAPSLADRPTLLSLAAAVVLLLISVGFAMITYASVEYPFLRLRELLMKKPQDKHSRNTPAVEAS